MAFEIWFPIEDSYERRILERKLARLQLRSFSELNGLAEHQTETIDDVTGARITTYRNQIPDSTVEIVAQLYVPGRNFLLVRFASVLAIGFHKTLQEEIQDAPNETLLDYM